MKTLQERLRNPPNVEILVHWAELAADRIDKLEAELAKYIVADKPVKYTTGHCRNHNQIGGCHLPNLQCNYPQCDRKAVK